MAPQQGDEGGRAETVVAHLDGVPEGASIGLPLQQREEGRKILLVEPFGRRELPQDRAELGPELRDAALDEAGDRRTRFGEARAIGRVARNLQRR